MARLFGTDGVRGVANIEPMTAETVVQIGRAVAQSCKRHAPGQRTRHRIVIGKDTRISGYLIESALTAGICSMGVDVLLVGPMPTPGIAFITRSMRADAGIVISASHNPYPDNGIKLFSRTGYKLPDTEEDLIERMVRSGELHDVRPTADDIGKAYRIDDALGRYIVFCKNTFPESVSLEGMKIAIDCANGATYKAAPIIFTELGAEVTAIHRDPDGLNINAQCGSQHTEGLCEEVLLTGADIGLAFDGDGDRLIVVDEKGREISGDHILAVCARMMKERGALKNNLAITTVMANFGLFRCLRELEIEAGVAAVGDRYVLEMMKERGAVLGGEASGHMIFLDYHTTGDGLITALQFLRALRERNEPVSSLVSMMQSTPQVLINIDVARKPPIEEVPVLVEAIQTAEAELADTGRVLVRYSGTQSMCRVMVEAPSREQADRLANAVSAVVRRELV